MTKIFENKVAVDNDKVTLNPVRYEAEPESTQEVSETESQVDSEIIQAQDFSSQQLADNEPEETSIDKDQLAEIFAEELATLKAEAQQKAYEEGMQTAEKHAAEQLEQLEDKLKKDYEEAIEQLNHLTSNIKTAIDETIQENESDLVEVVFGAVIKILGEKAADKTLIKHVVSENIKRCYESNITKIKLSQDDYKLFNSASEALDLELPNDIAIEPDVNLLPGGCKIETDKGTLDARLDSQIERFKTFLLENYRGTVD